MLNLVSLYCWFLLALLKRAPRKDFNEETLSSHNMKSFCCLLLIVYVIATASCNQPEKRSTTVAKPGFGPMTFIAQAPGPQGPKGEPGINAHSNWKQCAWTNINDGRDSGLIKECVFTKKKDATALRVVFDGDYRVAACTNCCRRWYFTFNLHECKHPAPIDAVQLHATDTKSHNIHQHRQIEGYCQEIPKGQVHVGFWVGACSGYPATADAYTGWMSTTRIIVSEVPPPQV